MISFIVEEVEVRKKGTEAKDEAVNGAGRLPIGPCQENKKKVKIRRTRAPKYTLK